MADALYTQIGSKTVYAQQRHQGDVVYIKSLNLDGVDQEGTATCGEGDWEVRFPNGTIEIWSNADFTAQYQ